MLAVNKQQPIIVAEREWKARLKLRFIEKNNRSVLKQREHIGPLVVQRPFYPEGDVCHVYLIHPPGGVVGGDKLSIEVLVEENAHALMTTPSAGKFYRSGQLTGLQQQQLQVEAGATLEWFPQETIFFNGCNSQLKTDIHLYDDAKFCGWEINCLGRPAAAEQYLEGRIMQSISLYHDGQPMFLERNTINGDDPLLQSRAGFQNSTVFATMLATGIDKKMSASLQEHWHAQTEKNISVTLINDVLIARYLGHSAEQAKKLFTQIWADVRQQQNQRAICAPRIWNT